MLYVGGMARLTSVSRAIILVRAGVPRGMRTKGTLACGILPPAR